jgi:hypothetical protein
MTIPKISQHNIFNSYSHPSLSLSFLSCSTPLSSILSPFRLRSVFPPLLSLPLAHFVAAAPHVLYRLTLLAAHPAPSLFSFRPIPVLSLLVSASESRHHFPLFRALPRFSDSLPSLLLAVSLSLSLSSAHILSLLIFPLPHWHNHSSCSTSLSPSHPHFFFFSL